MRIERLEVNGNKYLVKIYHEDRSNARVSIRRDEISIRIPLQMNREEQFRQLMTFKAWAINKLKENIGRFKPEIQKEYKNGDAIKVGDEEYNLDISFKSKQSSSARIIGNSIYLLISSDLSKEKQTNHISTLISRCVASKRLPKLHDKLNELNNLHFNQKINKIFFKHNKSNWGSCSKAGNINISTRLLFAPNDVSEYVCIHELAHIIEHNHSDKFWALVEKAMPDYKEKVQWLKENGGECRF